jgi:transposase
MPRKPEEIDAEDCGEVVERAAAIDVAKASGKVCTRVPHPHIPGRRVTKVWDVGATTGAIMALAEELTRQGIERVVVESTSDYWRPFVYLLEAHGLLIWLVNARDVKQVPGRPKTDLLTELPDRSFERCARRSAVLARFRPRDQRRGRAAGVLRVGGAAARLA